MPWYTRFWRSKTLRFCDVQLYGFPRLYRRMAELNRYINKNNPKRRESIENGLQRLFRLPTHIYRTLQRWRGVPDPPQGPPSATGHANSGASPAQHPSQQTQVRHIIINKYFLFLWICLYDVFISAKVCVLIFYLFHLLASAHKTYMEVILWYLDCLACMNCDEFSVSVIFIRRRSSLLDNIFSSFMHLLLSPTLSCYGWWVLSSVLHWAILLLPTEVPIVLVDCWSASIVYIYMLSRPTYVVFTPEKSQRTSKFAEILPHHLFLCALWH